MSWMSIKYKNEVYELTYSQFVTRLSYRYKYGKNDEIENRNVDLHFFKNGISFFDKLKFKYDMYQKSKLSWDRPLQLKNIFKNRRFVRDMYNCGKVDINDHDGFGWYSTWFDDTKIQP